MCKKRGGEKRMNGGLADDEDSRARIRCHGKRTRLCRRSTKLTDTVYVIQCVLLLLSCLYQSNPVPFRTVQYGPRFSFFFFGQAVLLCSDRTLRRRPGPSVQGKMLLRTPWLEGYVGLSDMTGGLGRSRGLGQHNTH